MDLPTKRAIFTESLITIKKIASASALQPKEIVSYAWFCINFGIFSMSVRLGFPPHSNIF